MKQLKCVEAFSNLNFVALVECIRYQRQNVDRKIKREVTGNLVRKSMDAERVFTAKPSSGVLDNSQCSLSSLYGFPLRMYCF